MLEVRLLGQFDVRLDGQAVDIPSRPAQSLLAYLLLNAGTTHRRERLAGLLWPEASEANARSNLRHAIWRLRRALGAGADHYLQADNFTVAFDPASQHWLDTAVLEQAGSADDAPATLAAAVGAYRGELLPGFYAEWIDLERERLHNTFERQMQTLLDQLAQAERWNDVLNWGERWIALGQAPEPAYRALMQAHSGLGDLGSLAAVYQRCQAALQRDLGVEPSEQTRALYERLRRPERAVAVPAARSDAVPPATSLSQSTTRSPAGNLPAPSTPLVGREHELSEVGQRLCNPDCRLLTLTGPGGIGKTRLALHAALREATTNGPFADGVYFVPLARVSDTDYLVSAIAEALRFSFYGGEEAAGQLHGHLREKQLLVVLDNFEHLLDGADCIAGLLRGAPGVKFLVTSQERLNLQGEWLYEVGGLDFPRGDAGEGPAAGYEAVRLFLQCAQRVDANFRESEADLPAIQRICQIVAGMPLGIELAAAWVRAISCGEIAREIERNLGFLTTTLRDVPERHRSLAAVFDYAWNRLSDDERRVFRRLSVFWGGFQREAAEQVAEASLTGLSALVDKSLLRRTVAGRYDMHGLLRKYGQLKLREAGEYEAVRGRHQAYYLSVAEQGEPGLRGGEQLQWLARLETEHDNLRAALKWSFDGEPENGPALEAGQRLAGSLARFWYLRGYWREGREWLADLLDKGPAGAAALAEPACAQTARAKALMGAGWLADENGSEGPLYEESLALCRAVGDGWGEAYSLRGVGVRVSNDDGYEPARDLLTESRALFAALGDEWGQGLVEYNLGWLAFSEDDQKEAQADWTAALERFKSVGDRWGSAVTLGSLAYLARLRESYPETAQLTEEGLSLFRELGDKAGIATSLLRLAQVALRRGSYPQAIELIHEGQALQREVEESRGLITSGSLLGLIACYQGQYDQAEALLSESRRRGEAMWGAEAINFVANYQGLVAYYRGDSATAQALWEHGVAVQRELEDRSGLGYCLFGLGRLAHDRGKVEQALELLQQSLELFKQAGDRRYMAIVLNALGRVLHGAGRSDDALAHIKKGLLMRKEAGDRLGLVESFEALVDTLLARAEAEALVRLLAGAAAMREEMGAPVPTVEQARYAQTRAGLRERLGHAQHFDLAWDAGRTLAAAPERLVDLAWTTLKRALPAA